MFPWFQFLAFVGALILRGHYEPFSVASGSMAPTLLTGDYVFVDRHAFREARPARGDVIVFRTADGTDFIKRVIALPGDTVQLRDDHILLDGAMLPETSIAPSSGSISRVQLPSGRSFLVARIGPGPFANTGPFTVGPESVFVLGDNLDNSLDSRMAQVGPVAFDAIRGRVMFVYFSTDPSRIGKAVR